MSGLDKRPGESTPVTGERYGAPGTAALEMAIAALEALRRAEHLIGAITNVAAMQDRIPVQMHVERRSARASVMLRPDGPTVPDRSAA